MKPMVFSGSRIVVAFIISIIYLHSLDPAFALPSYAVQTGQECSACHIGSFGPQLTPFGRDFKLRGYTLSDGKAHFPPVAGMLEVSYTHTRADQPGGAAPGFGSNDNLTLDQLSLFYAGRITDNVGSFIQATYDGTGHGFIWDNADIRFADDSYILQHDLVYGITFNNSPTVQDLWNSTPAWGFPFAASPLAPTPGAATLIDGGLAQQVAGFGAYAMLDGLLYLEVDAYRDIGHDLRNGLGVVPASGVTTVHGFAPYWRAALQHNFGNHYLELGTFGIHADLFPQGDNEFGADHITDTALDFTYQYTPSEEYNISAYGTYIQESQHLDASERLSGSLHSDQLRTLRANISFTYENTYLANTQYFDTYGSSDLATFGGRPNSAGWVGELDYIPSGKAGSGWPVWLNLKLAAQYVAYSRFDGSTDHASDNDNLYLLMWLAFTY